LMAGYLVQYCFNYTRSKRKSGRTGKNGCANLKMISKKGM